MKVTEVNASERKEDMDSVNWRHDNLWTHETADGGLVVVMNASEGQDAMSEEVLHEVSLSFSDTLMNVVGNGKIDAIHLVWAKMIPTCKETEDRAATPSTRQHDADHVWAHNTADGGIAVVMYSSAENEIPGDVLHDAAVSLSDDLLEVSESGKIEQVSLLWAKMVETTTAEAYMLGETVPV